MDLNEIDNLNLRALKSSESKLYFYKGRVYKIFNNSIDIDRRIDIINIFLNNNISNTPTIYDFIFDQNKIVGYVMKHYENAKPLSQEARFKFIKEKCLELIEIYLRLLNDYNICFYDFNSGNIFINNKSILLLDVDSCIKSTPEIEEQSKKLIIDYILSLIYKTYFFEYEVYFSEKERKIIRRILYTNQDKTEIKSINDAILFLENISKRDTQKTLKKLPYKIT